MTSTSVSSYTRNGKPVSGYSQQRQGAAYQPKHSVSRMAKIMTGATGATVSGLGMLESGFFLIGAIFTVAGSSVLAWGGYKGHKKRRTRRGATRPATGTKAGLFGTVRLRSEVDVDAYIKLKEWRSVQRKKKVVAAGHGVKVAGHAVASGARTVRAKVKP